MLLPKPICILLQTRDTHYSRILMIIMAKKQVFQVQYITRCMNDRPGDHSCDDTKRRRIDSIGWEHQHSWRISRNNDIEKEELEINKLTYVNTEEDDDVYTDGSVHHGQISGS
uniref:Uncharacterized protein n=1 Tax=Arion vulgaris TaxID=1028688 RepID=A0A0B7AQG2_9EUPU